VAQGAFGRAWELNPAGFLVVLALAKRVCELAIMARGRSWRLNHWSIDLVMLAGFFGFSFLRYFGAL
jgi:hypothetical protein